MSLEENNFNEVCRFVIRLGVLAYKYGTQTQQLESYLVNVIRALGYDGIFLVTPSEIQFTFMQRDELWQKNYRIYMPKKGLDLDKLGRVGILVTDLEKGNIILKEAINKLEVIDRLRPPYGKFIMGIGYAITSAGFAGFLKCPTPDIILSGILGVLVYFMVLMAKRLPERFEYWVPFFCAFISGSIATLASIKLPGLHVYLITLSAIIYLIPGFTISCGIMELSYKHVISGMINVVNGMVYMVLLFAGAWISVSIICYFFTSTVINESTIASHQLGWISAIIMQFGLCIIFQMPPKEILWGVLVAIIASIGIIFGMKVSGINLGNFIGTVLSVIFANIWSAKTNRSSSIVFLPAIIFLVSGSVGFRGFTAMSTGNTALGQEQFLHMFVVAITITMGLIVGNSIFKPKVSL